MNWPPLGSFIDPVDRNPLFLFVWTYIAMYWPPLVSFIDRVDTNPLFLFLWTYIAYIVMNWPPLGSFIDPVDANPLTMFRVSANKIAPQSRFSQSWCHQTRTSLQWWENEKKLGALLRFQWEVCLGFTSHNPRDTKHDQASLSRLSRQ